MKHERKVVAFYVHPDIGALKVYTKHQQPNGKYKIDTPFGEFENVPEQSLLLPKRLPTGIDL